MTTSEAFSILGLQDGSSKDEIKKANRELAKKHHPDVGGNEDEFKKAQESYAILTGKQKSDPEFTQDLFSDFGFGSIFDFNPFGGQWKAQPRIERPPEDESQIGVNFQMSISDIKAGRAMVINYRKSANCNQCNGVGGKSKQKCDICGGHGKIRQEKRAGNMHFVSTIDCVKCWSTGYTIIDKCKACDGNGFIVLHEKIHVDIKTR